MAGVGFDTSLWGNYCKEKKLDLPCGYGTYKSRHGKNGDLPQTKGHIILHVKAQTRSLAYETVDAFVSSLPSSKIESVEDHYGWKYRDGRDLSGFIDGTENVTGEEEREKAAVNSCGGSYLIHQRWEHNLKYFNQLDLNTQQHTFGRKKRLVCRIIKRSYETHCTCC